MKKKSDVLQTFEGLDGGRYPIIPGWAPRPGEEPESPLVPPPGEVKLVSGEVPTAPDVGSVTFVAANLGQNNVVSTETASLRLLNDAKYVLGGKSHLLMVTVEGPLRGYLVEESLVASDTKAVQTIDISTAIEVYSWEQEVENMLPDRETFKRNIVLSFWRAGAIDKDAAKQYPARRNKYDSAYPYKLEE